MKDNERFTEDDMREVRESHERLMAQQKAAEDRRLGYWAHFYEELKDIDIDWGV